MTTMLLWPVVGVTAFLGAASLSVGCLLIKDAAGEPWDRIVDTLFAGFFFFCGIMAWTYALVLVLARGGTGTP